MNEAVQSVGERLMAAREAKGFSVQKAADSLHLDPWVVEGLESGDYSRVGPSVYVKGHLKRYAGLLGLPEGEVLDAYAQGPRSAKPPEMPSQAAQPPPLRVPAAWSVQKPPWLRLAGLCVLLLAVVAILVSRVWSPRASRPAVAPETAASAAPAASGAGATAAADAEPTDRSAVASSAGLPPMAGAAPPRAAAAVNPADGDAPTGVGRARLRLRFSADSWVDVHDAAGRRLFAGKGRANSVKTIAGDAPIRVYLGFASGVQVEVNNRAVAIGPQFVAGDVARFEAGADGVLRRDAHAATTSSSHPRG